MDKFDVTYMDEKSDEARELDPNDAEDRKLIDRGLNGHTALDMWRTIGKLFELYNVWYLTIENYNTDLEQVETFTFIRWDLAVA